MTVKGGIGYTQANRPGYGIKTTLAGTHRVGRHFEGVFEQQRPRVKGQRCAQSNEYGSDKGVSQIIHETPSY
jgi:hypothetical protein